MKSKKAQSFMAEHGMGLVLAVLAIGVLLFLGFKIYGIFIGQQQEVLQAQESLDSIIAQVNLLEDSAEAREVIVLNPAKWALVSWSNLNQVPESCNGKNCICICDQTGSSRLIGTINDEFSSKRADGTLLKTCNSETKAVCSAIDYSIIEFSKWITAPIEMSMRVEEAELKVDINMGEDG